MTSRKQRTDRPEQAGRPAQAAAEKRVYVKRLYDIAQLKHY